MGRKMLGLRADWLKRRKLGNWLDSELPGTTGNKPTRTTWAPFLFNIVGRSMENVTFHHSHYRIISMIRYSSLLRCYYNIAIATLLPGIHFHSIRSFRFKATFVLRSSSFLQLYPYQFLCLIDFDIHELHFHVCELTLYMSALAETSKGHRHRQHYPLLRRHTIQLRAVISPIIISSNTSKESLRKEVVIIK